MTTWLQVLVVALASYYAATIVYGACALWRHFRR